MKKPTTSTSEVSTDTNKNSRSAVVAGGTETKDFSNRRRNHSNQISNEVGGDMVWNEDKNSANKNDIVMLPSMDIDSVNRIELPSESTNVRAAVPAEVRAHQAQHLDRARRSISVEARQANLIE